MGDEALNLIVEQLDQYIRSNSLKSTAKTVVLDNIATSKFAGGTNSALEDKVVVSLVNLEEEGALKNKRLPPQPFQDYLEELPPVYVNLYLLFTANFSDYKTAVNHLFSVLEFFQGQRIFSVKNALLSSETNTYPGQENPEARIEMDLHTLSFEQLNDLWGSLGGKQLPFVLYRARLVTVRMQRPAGRAVPITKMEVDTYKE